MLSLKSFIASIHDAILQASDSMMDKHLDLLERHFTAQPESGATGGQQILTPKMVTLEYHTADQSLNTVVRQVQVPLITLVPLVVPRIEKAVLAADFEMEIAGDEVQINFASPARRSMFGRPKRPIGRLEITLTPQETPEGLKAVVEAYERAVKAQVP